jgi:hypothetical protein
VKKWNCLFWFSWEYNFRILLVLKISLHVKKHKSVKNALPVVNMQKENNTLSSFRQLLLSQSVCYINLWYNTIRNRHKVYRNVEYFYSISFHHPEYIISDYINCSSFLIWLFLLQYNHFILFINFRIIDLFQRLDCNFLLWLNKTNSISVKA